MKLLKSFVILLLLSGVSYSQFDKPILQIGIGIAEPFDELKGKTYLMNGSYNNLTLTLIDSSLYKNHYAAQTGFNVFGSIKINFDKYNIVRGVGFASFTGFNTFQSRKSGNQVYVNPNNPNDYFSAPQEYNYSFSAFSFGLGLEIAPTSFTKVFSPFFGANIAFNSFTSTLERNPNSHDTVRFKATGFRIGVNFNAGIEYKFSKMFGMALGIKYDLGNLLLKESSNSSTSDFYEWGRTNGNLNDDEGTFRSSLPNYLSNNFPQQYTSAKKKINWGTIYLAANIYLNTNKTTKKSPTKK
jgi:hypothetical protein